MSLGGIKKIPALHLNQSSRFNTGSCRVMKKSVWYFPLFYRFLFSFGQLVFAPDHTGHHVSHWSPELTQKHIYFYYFWICDLKKKKTSVIKFIGVNSPPCPLRAEIAVRKIQVQQTAFQAYHSCAKLINNFSADVLHERLQRVEVRHWASLTHTFLPAELSKAFLESCWHFCIWGEKSCN